MEHPKHQWKISHVLVCRDVLDTASMNKSAIVHHPVFLLFFNARISMEMKIIVGLGLHLRSARHISA